MSDFLFKPGDVLSGRGRSEAARVMSCEIHEEGSYYRILWIGMKPEHDAQLKLYDSGIIEEFYCKSEAA